MLRVQCLERQDLRLKIEGVGFSVQGSEFTGQGNGFRVKG